MRTKLLNDAPERTFVLVLDTGDEVVSSLEAFAAEQRLEASRITAIGAFRRATLGYFDWDRKDYQRIAFDEQMEVLSMVGDFAPHEGKPKLHAHVVLGRRDASTCGGHLLDAIARPTLEVIVTDAPAHLRRERDPETGLALIKIGR